MLQPQLFLFSIIVGIATASSKETAHFYHGCNQGLSTFSDNLVLITSAGCDPAEGKKYGHVQIPGWYASTCGEDAYAEGPNWIGVADGVGGWAAHDPTSDAGLFSRTLLHHSIRLFEDRAFCFPNRVFNQVQCTCDPKEDILELINRGHFFAHSIKGSSTISLALFNHGTLYWANLGDSGIMVLRPEQDGNKKYTFKTLLRTQEQQHRFNMPFQLSFYESVDYNQGDTAFKADRSTLDLQQGDIVIAATDGVLDNLFDEDIIGAIQYCNLHIKDNIDFIEKVNKASTIITNLSYEFARKSDRVSPFAKHARENGYYYQGGKADDIAVVVGIVTQG